MAPPPNQSSINALNLPRRIKYYLNNSPFEQAIQKIWIQGIEGLTFLFESSRANAIPSVAFSASLANFPKPAIDVTLRQEAIGNIGAISELTQTMVITQNNVDQFEEQIMGVKAAIISQIAFQLIEGTGAPAFVGLKNHASTFAVSSVAGALSLADLHFARFRCRPSGNLVGGTNQFYWIGNEITMREIIALYEQAGVCPEWRYDADLDTEILIVDGAGFLISNVIPTNEEVGADRTSLYIAQFSGKTAIRLLYAKDPHNTADQFGIYVYDVPLQNVQNILGKTITWNGTLHYPESTSAVRLRNIKPTLARIS